MAEEVGDRTAFVSTLYGLGLANLILLPLANRIRASVAESYELGDQVFSMGRYGGTSPKTGKSAVMNWMFRWRLVDGKIVLFDSHIDSAMILTALA